MQRPRRIDLAIGVLGGAVLVALGLLVHQVLIDEGLIHWSEDRIERSITSGLNIVSAIDAYKATHGEYPQDLDELTPQVLNTVPMPVAGTKRWVYRVMDDDSYRLSFGSGRDHYPSVTYLSRERTWRRDQ